MWVIILVIIIYVIYCVVKKTNDNHINSEAEIKLSEEKKLSPLETFTKEIEEEPILMTPYLADFWTERDIDLVSATLMDGISCDEITSEYLRNQIEFFERYKDKLIVLRDKFKGMELSNIYIKIFFGDGHSYNASGGIVRCWNKMECRLLVELKDDLKNATVGQEFIVMGILDYDNILNHFIMDNCAVVAINGTAIDRAKQYCINAYLKEKSSESSV